MRETSRKKRILEILSRSNPEGISLLNELRIKCTWAGEFKQSKSRKSDQRKSFNRTILGESAGLHVSYISDERQMCTDLSVGLFARWAIWELLDQGYLTDLPESDEMEIVVGHDACSVYIKLRHNQLAIIGTAVFMKNIILVGNRPIDENDLKVMSRIPWATKAIKKDAIYKSCDLSVYKLDNLPPTINYNGKTNISTAKKKFRVY